MITGHQEVTPHQFPRTSGQIQNRLERLADSIAAFFGGLLHDLLDDDEDPADPETEADKPDDMAAQLEAEGIDSSALPSERGEAYKDAFIDAQAKVGAAMGAVVLTAGEQATVGRLVRVIRPGGRLLGVATGSNSRVRELPGGQRALRLFGRVTKGGTVIRDSGYPGRLVELALGVRVGYRGASKSGPPTVDVFHGGTYVKFKFID